VTRSQPAAEIARDLVSEARSVMRAGGTLAAGKCRARRAADRGLEDRELDPEPPAEGCPHPAPPRRRA
jgi:hypothetical protein